MVVPDSIRIGPVLAQTSGALAVHKTGKMRLQVSSKLLVPAPLISFHRTLPLAKENG